MYSFLKYQGNVEVSVKRNLQFNIGLPRVRKARVSRKSQKKTFCKQNENYPLHVSNFRKELPETEPIKNTQRCEDTE